MNRITRILTITGLGLFAGMTIGAGPAMASTNTGQGAAKPATADAAAKPGDRVAGYYDSRDECRVAGRIGDHLGRWDDWDCYPADNGWHHGDWVLVVDYNFDGGGFPFGHSHHGGFPFPHGGFPFHHLGGGLKHNDKDPLFHQHKGGMKDDTKNNVGMPTAKPGRG
jgi:hypothetical protein